MTGKKKAARTQGPGSSANTKRRSKKDEVRMAILVIGIAGGLLILFGLYRSLASLTSSSTGPSGLGIPCLSCITEAQNGQKFTFQTSDSFTLNLPQALYPKEGLTIIDSSNVLTARLVESSTGRWGAVFTALKSGTDEIIVKSASNNISDFHVSIVVK